MEMSDLVDRQDVLDVLKNLAFDYMFQCGEYYGEDERQLTIINAKKAIDVIETMPSVEPDRIAKVIIHKRYIGTSLNIVGTPSILCEHLCGACKKKVIDGDDYCSHCGARLEWNE